MDSVTSAATTNAEIFDLSTARNYAERLSHHAESGDNPALQRLNVELNAAIAAAEAADQQNASVEDRMEQQSLLLWLCNQCDYYTDLSTADQSSSTPAPAKARTSQGLWQIRSVISTLAFLKLLNNIRSFLPGAAPPAPAWREISPGFRLWTMGSKRNKS